MKKFNKHLGVVVPLDRSNVDTDAIIPKQFLRSIKKSGFGPDLFYAWRYLPSSDELVSPEPNPDFVLNMPCYKNASIMLARANFGCGSSREHAPWALVDYGIRSIIAPSFGNIFQANCVKNGLLPIILEQAIVDQLFSQVHANPGSQITIDLQNQLVSDIDQQEIPFEIDSFSKECLLNGWDEIDLTLQHESKIRLFEEHRRSQYPWLFSQSVGK